MKKLFTIAALAVGMVLPMQAQNAYIYKNDGTTFQVPAEKMYFNTIDGEEYITTEDEVDLDAICGDYTVYGLSAFEGGGEDIWEMTITADETDPDKVWIHPFCFWQGITAADQDMISPIYATYDRENEKLLIPSGQTLLVDGNYHFVLGYTTYDDPYFTPFTTGNIEASVTTEGMSKTLFITNMYVGVGDVNDPEGEGWWYQALYDIYMITDFSKKIIPLTDIEQISTTAPEAGGNILKNGNYIWSFEYTEDDQNWSNQSTTTTFTDKGNIDLSEIYGAYSNGIWAKVWSVSGFFGDTGLFEGGENYPITGYDYTSVSFEDGMEYQFLDFVDIVNEYGYCQVGKTVMTDENGNEVLVDMFLADIEGNSLYSELYFTAYGNVYMYDGLQLCMWYLYEGQAHLMAYLNNTEIARAGASAAPQMVPGKVEWVKNAFQLGASQKLDMKGMKKARKF